MLRIVSLIVFLFMPLSAVQAQVVVTIKPLHSLALAVMEGSGEEPLLLVDGKASLHEFTLRPSQAKALRTAHAVVYMGDEFEPFLEKILPQLPTDVKRLAMEESPGMMLYPVRVGVGFETHEHHDGHEHHDAHQHENHDLHAWMSPTNARAMVKEMARAFSEISPAHAALFKRNADALDKKLSALDAGLQKRMEALKGKPFVVFHDAYQYFDRAYDLKNIGSITLHPEQGLSARRVSELRKKIKRSGAVCVFREPEFEGKIVENLMQGTNTKTATLDPEGALLEPGVELYFQLMEGIATQLEACLNRPAA